MQSSTFRNLVKFVSMTSWLEIANGAMHCWNSYALLELYSQNDMPSSAFNSDEPKVDGFVFPLAPVLRGQASFT